MAKYRKKPIVIEAFQWWTYMGECGGVRIAENFNQTGENVYVVDTLEGPLRVSPDDWIITGVKGEHYPCKPDIFEATYEAVEAASNDG